MKKSMQPWEVIIFVLAGVLLTCWLTSCGINHATQRVLTNESARNQVGRIWADLHPCAVDSVIHYKSDTAIVYDTIHLDEKKSESANILYGDSLNGLSGNTRHLIPDYLLMGKWNAGPIAIRKTVTIRDSAKVDKTDLRILNALKSDTAYYRGQIASWKDRAAEYKRSSNKWLWFFIGACIASALGVGLYMRSIFTKLPNFIKK